MKTISKSQEKVKRVAVYQNLPSGGARERANLNIKFLRSKYRVNVYSDDHIYPGNLLTYLLTIVFRLPILHLKLAAEIANNNDILIGYHSWLTKSPMLFVFLSRIPKIYICEEGLREYYDHKHIALQTFKDKLVNLFRTYIKWIDHLIVSKFTDLVIVNSKFSKSYIDTYYGIKAKIIYPGIDVGKYVNKNRRFSEKNQIISVGRISKLKNQKFIVEFVSRMAGPKPSIMLIGDGGDINYINEIENLARSNDLELTIKTNVSKKYVISRLHESKLFVYSPINEPFGIVIEEALAAGLPVLAYKYGGGYSEILNKNNGVLMENENPESWAKAASELLQNNIRLNNYSSYNRSKAVLSGIDQEIMNLELSKTIDKYLGN